MIRSVDLSSLICVCGARANFHRTADNAQLSCAEAIDRQFRYSDELPQTEQQFHALPPTPERRTRPSQINQRAGNRRIERV